MSYTCAAAETSWFPVQDPDKFVEFCQLLDVAFIQDHANPSRFILSAANGEGCWPSSVVPSELFEEWPAWLPIPPEGIERIARLAEQSEESASANTPDAKRNWMTNPAEWPEDMEFDFFELLRDFMQPGSAVRLQSCVFDGAGYDLGLSGGVLCQDGRTVWVDFEDHLKSLQTSLNCTCIEDASVATNL